MLRRLYDWTMAKAAHPHATWWLAAFAFMEASFFPIPPHPLLGLMCLANPKRAIFYASVTVVASVAGGLLGYAIGYFLYDSIGVAMISALGLTESFPKAACYLNENAFWFILFKGATPIPFKLITITAGFIQVGLVTFILASIASRGFTFLLVGILFRVYGAPIKAFIDKYLGLVTAAFIILVVGGFWIVSQIEGESDACSAATSLTAL